MDLLPLNRLVRSYLAHFPVTEGKKAVLRLTRNFIRPADADQVAATKHGFRLRLNLANPEHDTSWCTKVDHKSLKVCDRSRLSFLIDRHRSAYRRAEIIAEECVTG